MKFCEKCGEEIATKDGDNRCRTCEDGKPKRGAKKRKATYESVLKNCGLTKVRGALGGVYWE